MPSAERFDLILEAFRRDLSIEEVHERCLVDRWFLRELEILAKEGDGTEGLQRTYKAVDTCAAEFEAATPYYYSAHERPRPGEGSPPRSAAAIGDSVVILGAGPNRIGQGIEFDYCCVHAAMTARESGRDAVMINCNPETVSTDYDTSDRLYFEPLTTEDVLAVCEQERPEGVIVQFGGQTPLQARPSPRGGGRAAARHAGRRDRPRRGPRPLRRAAAPARGRAPALRDGALAPRRPTVIADRSASRCWSGPPTSSAAGRWRSVTRPRTWPPTSSATSRPTRSIRCCSTASSRTRSRSTSMRSPTATDVRGRRDHAARRGGRGPLRRLGLRAAADEPRRGDARARSAQTTSGSRSSSASIGLINIQYAVAGGELYVIEANPRASRTVPFVSKAIGAPLAKLACAADARRAARRPGAADDARTATSASRRRCCPSPASPAPTRCSGRR